MRAPQLPREQYTNISRSNMFLIFRNATYCDRGSKSDCLLIIGSIQLFRHPHRTYTDKEGIPSPHRNLLGRIRFST
jgi:hypothetical protein